MLTGVRLHAVRGDGLTHHYATVGEGPPLVLIHGFPQTWRMWTPLAERLADRYRIIAPSLRGLGGTEGPQAGYDKHTLARDVRVMVERECGDQPATVVGHDLGSHVAFAYALSYRPQVSGLVLAGPPPPGTTAADGLMTNPRTWHLAFHAQTQVAHLLISGKERAYFEYFIRSRIVNDGAITQADIDDYAAAYAAPGALRCALEMYRSLAADREVNLAALASGGRLANPVAAVASAAHYSRASTEETLRQVCTAGRAVLLQECGHWIPQERPDVLAEVVVSLGPGPVGG
jgi:pimeloyl-ACP methyl ester carboxylesterase